MAHRITFLNQKGGVGKTTAAALVAASLASDGQNVAVDDRDPQRSLSFWASEVGKVPLWSPSSQVSFIITDTPGRLDFNQENVLAGFVNLLEASQTLVLVTEKTLFSLHALAPLLHWVKKHRAPNSKLHVLFNKVRLGTQLGRQEEGELLRRLNLEAEAHSLPLSTAFERFETEGLGALDMKKRKRLQALTRRLLP